MHARPARYRSTLIAAAVAIGCCAAATAEARDHGWRGHDQDRGWDGRARGWHDRAAACGGYPGDGSRVGCGAPLVREGRAG